MRRSVRGGTNRPPLARPGNGYGRPAKRRPGPAPHWDRQVRVEAATFDVSLERLLTTAA